MGIDAQMLVKVPRVVTDDELRRWSYLLGSMAHSALSLGYDEHVYHKPLERISEYEQDGDTLYPMAGETFLYVPLNGRYYGTCYERGDLLTYVGIAEFLETLIPGCAIWYGGDSSGVSAAPFDKATRAALLQHAALYGHDQYNAAFDGLRGASTSPSCPVCAVLMPQCGFGGNGTYAMFRCSGCGWEIVNRDGTRTQGFNASERERKKAS